MANADTTFPANIDVTLLTGQGLRPFFSFDRLQGDKLHGSVAAITAEDLRDRVLHLDHDVLILDKPAGLLVHPGPRGQGSLSDFLPDLWFEMASPPALAHRLDRDTSGCLVLGRHQKALMKLGKLFSRGLVDKTYWAIVRGVPPADQGRIDLPLLKVLPETGGWGSDPIRRGCPPSPCTACWEVVTG